MRYALPLALLSVVLAFANQPAIAGQKVKPLTIDGDLAESDPVSKTFPQSKFKSHMHKFDAGKTYRIDVKSKDFDTFLRLETAEGRVLAQDDDGGGGLNSRIVYEVKEAAELTIVVLAFDRKVGNYSISIGEASADEILMAKAARLPSLPASERTTVVAAVTKMIAGKGADIGIPEAQLVMKVVQGLEFGKVENAGAYVTPLAKALSASSDKRVSDLGARMSGVARRLDAMGKTLEIHGKTLEGKDFDWSKYKGKVVLVDFWATWCRPCIAEIPRMKKAYEEYKDRGFEIVAISVDRSLDKEKAVKFMQSKKLDWVCLFDEDMPEGKTKLSDYYGVMAIPLPILVDQNGNVVSMQARGPELDRLLEGMLGKSNKK